MNQPNHQEKFYQIQNISIRKYIRELDFILAIQSMDQYKNHEKSNPSLNIMVLGPNNSGKTSLIKSMFYALNGTSNVPKQSIISGNTYYEKTEIKKNVKSKIKGCSQVKDIGSRFGISTLQIVNFGEDRLPYDKYRKACYLLQGKIMACFKQVAVQTLSINFVIICLSLTDKITIDDLNGIKYLIAELQQKKTPYLVMGTKIDKIIGHNANADELNCERIEFIQNWKQYVSKNTGCKKWQIYLIENYHKQKIQKQQSLTFYILNVLQKIIKMYQDYQKSNKKTQFKFLTCTC